MQSTFWKRTICSVLACSSLFYSLPLSSAADTETGASASETESTEPTEPPDDPVVSSTDTPAETTETATETILEEPDDDNISLGDLTGDGMIAVDDAVFVLTIYATMAAGAEVNLTPNQFFYSDCNHDGKVDVTDAVLILEYYAKRAAGATELSFSDYMDQKNQQPDHHNDNYCNKIHSGGNNDHDCFYRNDRICDHRTNNRSNYYNHTTNDDHHF